MSTQYPCHVFIVRGVAGFMGVCRVSSLAAEGSGASIVAREEGGDAVLIRRGAILKERATK
jgi:hypothetical protein